MDALGIVFFIAVVVLLFWVGEATKQKRRAALAQLAREMGLDFSENDIFDLKNQLHAFELFGGFPLVNLFCHVVNVLPGVLEETHVFLFDYTSEKSNRRRSVQQTVFVAIDPNWKLPDFRFRHDRWYEAKLISRHRKPGGDQKIEFSRDALRLHETEELVRESLVPELQSLLTEYHPAQIEVCGSYLLIYKPARLLGAEASRSFYEDCCALTELLKSKNQRQNVLRWAELKGRDY
jgi:hypothetical protein